MDDLSLGQMIALAIAACVCFAMAVYFFRKTLQLKGVIDGPWGDPSGDVNVINLKKVKRKIDRLDGSLIPGLYTNNMLIKLLVEEGTVLKAQQSGAEGKAHAADLLKVAEYFKIESESFEKMVELLKSKQVDKVAKFNEDTISYVSWFVHEYMDIESLLKKVETERVLLSKHIGKRDKQLVRRMLVLNLYEALLTDIRMQVDRANKLKDSMNTDESVEVIA